MNIKKYRLVTDRSEVRLERMVNDLIIGGWQPLGGVASTHNVYDYPIYVQAMVVYERPENLGPG